LFSAHYAGFRRFLTGYRLQTSDNRFCSAGADIPPQAAHPNHQSQGPVLLGTANCQLIWYGLLLFGSDSHGRKTDFRKT
jgi:hypothetical protein